MKKLLLLIILLYGCSSKENIRTIDMPDPEVLQSTDYSASVNLFMAAGIYNYKDKLIVFEPIQKGMFKVYDLNTLEYLYSFGNRGRSKTEFVSSIGFQDVIISNDFEVLDFNTIKSINLTDTNANIISNNKPLPLSILKNPVNRLKRVDGDIYYFDNIYSDDSKKEFAKIDLGTKKLTYFSDYPKWIEREVSNETAFLSYSKTSTYNNSQKKIAAFYFHYPVMKIIDEPTGSIIEEIHIELDKFSYNTQSDNILFAGAVSSDKYIYAMWINKSKSDIEGIDMEVVPTILKFNWNGDLLASYELSHNAVTFTVVNDIDIYTPSFDDTNMIHKYKIPTIKPNVDFPYFKNKLYTIDLFPSYKPSQVSIEDGIDNIVQEDHYTINTNYFVQEKDSNGDCKYNLQSIKIDVIDLESEMVPVPKLYNGNIIRTNKNIIKNQEVINTVYKAEFRTPTNTKKELFTDNYEIRTDNRILSISISSYSDNFAQYQDYINWMVQSIKVIM